MVQIQKYQSVHQLVAKLKSTLAGEFPDIEVTGELSGVTVYRSRHMYFCLKDAEAELQCVMFRSHTSGLSFSPQDGLSVRVKGKVSVYEPRGTMQLIVRSMTLLGEGSLQQAIEALRKKLQNEGLFEPARKRQLPLFPQTIGIITSGEGAVQHDIRRVLGRRFPRLRIVLCPVRVQGEGAAEEIALAIETFNHLPPDDPRRPDILIVGRGGGSAEDLAAFSEERTARALFASRIPTISAVGHDSDHPISDDVADVRAATPSEAAEKAVRSKEDVAHNVRKLHQQLTSHARNHVRQQQNHIERLSDIFQKPESLLHKAQQRLDETTEALHQGWLRRLEKERTHILNLQKHLEALDPRRPLRQGFVRVDKEGQPIRTAADLQAGDLVALHFHDASLPARIEKLLPSK